MLENSVLSSIVPYGPPEGVSAGTAVPNTSPDSWTGTGSAATLPASISSHGQSTLPDGRVLVSGRTSDGYRNYIYVPSNNTWTAVASLSTDVTWGQAQSTLLDGRVMVSGGQNSSNCYNAIYIYSPDSNTWSTMASSPSGFSNHAQSTMGDGRVLVSAGFGATALNTAYIYTPSAVGGGYWTSAASLDTSFWAHGQSTLNDGRVLVVSPVNAYAYMPADSPGLGSWVSVTPIPTAISYFRQSTLVDNKVLVSGGENGSGYLNTTYIYTPDSARWDMVVNMPTGFSRHGQSTLADGRVLVSGGYNGDTLNTAYIYTPTGWVAVGTNVCKTQLENIATLVFDAEGSIGKYLTEMLENSVLSSIVPYGPPEGVSAGTAVPNTSPDSWTGTGSAATLPASIQRHGQSTLPDGRVLISGGAHYSSSIVYLNTCYIYTPSTNTWEEVASLSNSFWGHGQSTLLDGGVVVSGGYNGSYFNTVYVYAPDMDRWDAVASLPGGRDVHGQSTLLDGKVLVSGGYGNDVKNYVYIPSSTGVGSWESVASLPTSLYRHGQSTKLDGTVIASGGNATYVFTPTGIGTWTSSSTIPVSKSGHGQSTLSDNRVLVSGGNGNNCYIYTTGGTWSSAPNYPENISYHLGQSTLVDGRVLVTGGASAVNDNGITLNTTYIYTPTGWVAVGTNEPGVWYFD